MARLGASKKKKSPHATELSQLKKELQRVNEQLESRDRELEQRNAELSEALEQQTATSEILGVIASSPTDIQPVLNTIAENAALLCEASDALIYRVDGSVMRRVAHYGPVPMAEGMEIREISPQSVNGQAIIEHQTIHVHDLLDERTRARYPETARLQDMVGHRTMLVTPLVREGVAVGTVVIRRMEVRPFSEKQIALLETFAKQAVIAIENARLFQEQQVRNREISALHDVTASANQSLEIKPVLYEVVKKITEIFAFDAVRIYPFDAGMQDLYLQASFGTIAEVFPLRAYRRGQSLIGRVPDTGEPMVFENVQTDPRYLQTERNRRNEKSGILLFRTFSD